MGVRRYLAMIAGAVLLAAPAVAQPDFAAAFQRLDANGDGVIAVGELRHEGVDAPTYARPIAGYVTDDGYVVELWHTPFGVRVSSRAGMTLAATKARQDMIFLRDVPVRVAPWLMLAGNPELRTMTAERFERELQAFADKTITGLDRDSNGGVSTVEIDRMLLDVIEAHARDASFQNGPGGDAMRAHAHKLRREYYASLDLDGDGAFTADEMLESVLTRMVAAYALPKP